MCMIDTSNRTLRELPALRGLLTTEPGIDWHGPSTLHRSPAESIADLVQAYGMVEANRTPIRSTLPGPLEPEHAEALRRELCMLSAALRSAADYLAEASQAIDSIGRRA